MMMMMVMMNQNFLTNLLLCKNELVDKEILKELESLFQIITVKERDMDNEFHKARKILIIVSCSSNTT